ETPYRDLPEKFQNALCHGTGDRVIAFSWGENGKREKVEKPFEGLVASLQRLYDTTESEFTRQRVRQYMSRRTCSVCNGARLKPEILAVTVSADFRFQISDLETGERTAVDDANSKFKIQNSKSLNIHQFCRLTIADAKSF